MPVWVQWVSFVLAVVGSLSGLIALYLNFQRTTITKRIEKERLETKKKAKFRMDRAKEMLGRGMQDYFHLRNFGENEARNVKVKFYKENKDKDDRREVFPLYSEIPSAINSGQTAKAILVLQGGRNVPFEVVITWEDDFKSENELKEILN